MWAGDGWWEDVGGGMLGGLGCGWGRICKWVELDSDVMGAVLSELIGGGDEVKVCSKKVGIVGVRGCE